MLLDISFHFKYFPLLVIAAIAWITPIALSLLKLKKIPSVIVEIALGYFIGKYLLRNVDHESFRILEFFALTGFIFLMFLSGLEIDVDQILASLPRRKLTYKRFIRNPLLVSLVYFVLSVVLAFGGTLLLSRIVHIPHIWYFSLILVTTSVGIVVPVLKQRGEIKEHFGQHIVIAAAVADIFSIILFTITAIVYKNGFEIEILYLFGLFFFFIIFYSIGKRLKNIPLLKNLGYQLSHAASQIRIRSSILMIMLFVVAAQFIGDEAVLLGAFLIGLALSSMLHRERSVMLLKLDGMGYGFFIPFFFIMVGEQFDPSALKEFDQSLIWFLVLLLITLFAIKIIPALLWKKLFGIRRAIAGGFLMSSRLSLIIAASAVGLELGVITPGINASFIIMAIITCFISPVAYNLMSPESHSAGGKLFIIGGSHMAVVLARRLIMHGKKPVIIEKNPARAGDISAKGLHCIEGDGREAALYEKLKLDTHDYIIVNTGEAEENYLICEYLRKELTHDNIISLVNTSDVEVKLTQLGVHTVDVVGVMATTIENLLLRPATYRALVESFEYFSVEEIPITKREIDGLQFKEIPFHSDAIIIMVKRGNSFFIPQAETFFRVGDILHVFGTQTAIQSTREKVGRGTLS
jgi:Kef-type K+ transport system membrane component KefB